MVVPWIEQQLGNRPTWGSRSPLTSFAIGSEEKTHRLVWRYMPEGGISLNNKAVCCCGDFSIETQGDPLIHAVCHCSNCKKRTGSAFGVSAYYKDSQIINIVGETSLYEINNERQQKRYFCKKCGTTLYWKVSALPGITGIASGCFTKELPTPSHNLSNENTCAWIELPKEWKLEIRRRDFR